MTKVAVVGAGAWGTAFAMHAASAGLDVGLLGSGRDSVEPLAATRRHPALAGAPPIPDRVAITSDAVAAFEGTAAVLWAVSVQGTADEAGRLREFLPDEVPLVSLSKGLEIGSKRRTTQILGDVLRRAAGLAVFSGPTFAVEVARGLPAAAVVASADPEIGLAVQKLLASPTFRLYRSTDVVGVEIAGAAKNVVAIAAGILDGLNLGHNVRAALLTRALAEIRRLGTTLGGQPDTFAGLAGIGDLLLTATGDLSRNRRVGLALAAGKSVSEAVSALGGEVAEGVATAAVLVDLARSVGVEMPIAEIVVDILSGQVSPKDALRALMTRRLKQENG
ncbi:MAG TPA: NAD(P)H-dependent glycerol-3-phosphate dehydrogenase [Thermoanaerobaculia bacterium]|nr:NAD(P)H-dependent glycerol-3-phosphate dehydrogenase [Thermoanaerobaculia bacterium]